MPLDQEFVISELETLKVIGDAFRLQILKALREPKTVKEVAAMRGLPPTKLYYHFNQLEKHRLIRVVETNVVSGIIEKSYQASARRYRIAENLLPFVESHEDHIDQVLSRMFAAATEDIKNSIKAGIFEVSAEPPFEKGVFWRSVVHLSPAQLADFAAKIETLFQECQALEGEPADETAGERAETKPYGVTVAFYQRSE